MTAEWVHRTGRVTARFAAPCWNRHWAGRTGSESEAGVARVARVSRPGSIRMATHIDAASTVTATSTVAIATPNGQLPAPKP
jgi:hypothetical protein